MALHSETWVLLRVLYGLQKRIVLQTLAVQGLLGGSWVAIVTISTAASALIWLTLTVVLLIPPLIAPNEPPSRV